MGQHAQPLSVAVVGGGWAGCAAAAELAAAGLRVTLIEAAAELGGRARKVELELAGETHRLDNGQHLLLGAYHETAALFSRLGIALDDVVQRQPFALRFTDGVQLQVRRLPAPWHLAVALVTARGLALADRFAMVRLLRGLEREGWRVSPDRPVAEWLRERQQPPRVIARLWRPLTLAALNTPLEQASAQIFANVLRDSLGASRTSCDFWLPRTDLSALFPDAVERRVIKAGGTVLRATRVEAIAKRDDGFELTLRGAHGARWSADRVVFAAAPKQLAQIAAAFAAPLHEPLQIVERFSYEPIATVYLKYPRSTRLPQAFLALCEDPQRQRFGQWVFDRGALEPDNAGVLSVVISASGAHQSLSLDDLTKSAAAQLSLELGLHALADARAIVERRATLRAAPDLKRPDCATALPGLVLAGDWTASEYPSTLETAVRSGVNAARLLLC